MKADQIADIRVESDVYIAGNGEDGPVHAMRYYVVAETKAGEVFVNNHAFAGCEKVTYDDGEIGFAIIDAEPKALALAERIYAHIASGNALNDAHWYYRRPVYGSAPYLQHVAEMTREERAA